MANGYAGMSDRDLKMATVASACLGTGGGGGSGQIVYYTGADPNSDGVVPANQAAAAIAVKPSATTYTWDNVNLIWT
jgi:hypothetical protein